MEKVQSRQDSWNANLYDLKHSFVSEYGNYLVALLGAKSGERILDLGCGTGDLAKKLQDEGVEVVGVDKSANMVEQASDKYPSIRFLVGDATELNFDHEFDAVFSNATLHWVQPPLEALKGIYQSLKQNGRFVAEFGGKGNVQTIANEIIKQIENSGTNFNRANYPWYYPSIGEYTTLMEKAGFRVTLAQHIDRPTTLEDKDGLKNWMEMFATSFFKGIPVEQKDKILEKVEENLKDILWKEDKWIADYKRIRVIGIKE